MTYNVFGGTLDLAQSIFWISLPLATLNSKILESKPGRQRLVPYCDIIVVKMSTWSCYCLKCSYYPNCLCSHKTDVVIFQKGST